METIVIVTECTNPYGKYWEFKDKQSGQVLAEVDKKKRSEFDGPLYFIYTERGGTLIESARRSKKCAAFEFAKQSIRERLEGQDVRFKWSPIVKHFKWS